MLEHLRQRVIQTLANAHTLALSTNGPAGLQSSCLPCEAFGLDLYVLVPRTSDHLFNIESQPEVAAANENWNLKGLARVLSRIDYPAGLALTHCPAANWSEVIQIHPSRLNILRPESESPAETIDIES
jgi:hypothetical protein